MNPIIVIAKNTFRQTIRDKILYGIAVFAFIFLGSTVILASLALEEDIFIIRNLGLAGIYIFGLIITLFMGASLVYDEVEKRTTYILLSKPVNRGDILIGKFLGLLAGIGLVILLMTVAYILIVNYNGGGFDLKALTAVALQMLELGILIAVLVFFSTFTTPLASTIYTILIVYMGHLLGLALEYSRNAAPVQKYLLTFLYYLAPNLEKYNLRGSVIHNIDISPKELTASVAYALLYILLLLLASKLIFDKKDL